MDNSENKGAGDIAGMREKLAALEGFDSPVTALAKAGNEMLGAVASRMFRSSPDDIRRTDYGVSGEKWSVFETPAWKSVTNASRTYNYFFSKLDGLAVRFGRTPDEDPEWCPLGPEILDLEISKNGCIPIGGHMCRFCYKSNTSAPPTNMDLAGFRAVMGKFPKNLSQVAFGITALHANPDFIAMARACREEFGAVPNVTTSGADMDDAMADALAEHMGACAVSCYEADPSLCYSSIRRLREAGERRGRDFHVNMHLLFSSQTLDFVMKTLGDVRDGKVPGIRSVVLLRLKNVGNAKSMDPSIPEQTYRDVVSYCLDNGIRFGFDSCGAKTVMRVLRGLGRPELESCCEPCESSSFSAFVNAAGEYTSCSFVENRPDVIRPLKVADYASFTDLWSSPEVAAVRKATHACAGSCPWYRLD